MEYLGLNKTYEYGVIPASSPKKGDDLHPLDSLVYTLLKNKDQSYSGLRSSQRE